jgi:hypothetical protein
LDGWRALKVKLQTLKQRVKTPDWFDGGAVIPVRPVGGRGRALQLSYKPRIERRGMRLHIKSAAPVSTF